MKAFRFLVFTAAGVVVVVGLALAVSAYWERKQPIFQNATKLIAALQAFTSVHSANGRQLPPEVSLQELVGGGYLTTNDVEAFKGMDVTLSTRYADTNPTAILARARTSDGQVTCLLADGSVQGFSASMYKELLENSGQSSGPSNGSQSIRSETNSTSGPADSRR